MVTREEGLSRPLLSRLLGASGDVKPPVATLSFEGKLRGHRARLTWGLAGLPVGAVELATDGSDSR
jgi:hypothetical protein